MHWACCGAVAHGHVAGACVGISAWGSVLGWPARTDPTQTSPWVRLGKPRTGQVGAVREE